jgi:hypothetical protein
MIRTVAEEGYGRTGPSNDGICAALPQAHDPV